MKQFAVSNLNVIHKYIWTEKKWRRGRKLWKAPVAELSRKSARFFARLRGVLFPFGEKEKRQRPPNYVLILNHSLSQIWWSYKGDKLFARRTRDVRLGTAERRQLLKMWKPAPFPEARRSSWNFDFEFARGKIMHLRRISVFHNNIQFRWIIVYHYG